MGTDIHAVFQKREGNDWVDILCEEWQQDRHYKLFAWLTDVMNGYGFAACKTHDPIKPISIPRGLPEDFQMDDGEYHNGKWLGYHSHSWLKLTEILETPVPTFKSTGYIHISEYKTWDKKSHPQFLSGGIWGINIHTAESPEEITPETTHIRIKFEEDNPFEYFITAIRNLVEKHGTETRMVFGFSS